MPGPPATKPGSARKRDKAAYARKRRTQTVHLGAYIKEWNYIKSKMDCKTDQEVAVLLIDSYNTNEDRKRKRLVASTPCISQSDYLSGWSGVSSIHSLGKMSGIDLLTDTSQSESEQRKVTDPNSFSMAVGHQTCAKVADCMSTAGTAERSSFIRFHETTISEDAGANACDEDDPTYVPSLWDMSLDTKFLSVLNHCANRHEWGLGQCDHEEITDDEDRGDKKWLSPCGPEMEALEKVTTDKRFLRTFKYYVTCQTTSELESFNNHILMYASKRQSFTYGVYKCRCQLAAIDYMKHLERPYLKNKKGDQCYCRTFSKATNHWGVKPLKVKKDYLYMKDIMLDIVNDHISRETPLSRHLKPVEGDPILLARTIAPMDPPPTQQLVLEQSQRLKLNWGKPATTSDDV